MALGAVTLVMLAWGCVQREIIAVTVGEVRVDPPNASLLAGDTLRFRATVVDVEGRELPRAMLTWSSVGPEFVSVDETGLATALGSGSTRIEATFRGVTGSASITVLQSPTIRLSQDTAALVGAAGSGPPPPVVIEVRNGGGGNLGTLATTVQYPPGQPTGWVVTTLGATDAPTTLTLGAETAGLSVGAYNATVLLSSPDDVDSPVFIPVSLSLMGLTIVESDGQTRVAEAGGVDTMTVVLDAQPLSDVVLNVQSADPAEVGAAPATLTFTPSNWDQPQRVIVTGQDDDLTDGDRSTDVVISVDDELSEDRFDPISDMAVGVVTVDDDAASATIAESGGGTTVDESGTTDDFTVVLDAAPLSPVVFDVTPGDPTEAAATPTTLTFTPDDWDTPQTVTVAGVDDSLIDGDAVTAVRVAVNAATSDDAFDALPVDSVLVTTTDDDAAGLTIVQVGPTEPGADSTSVTEAGSTDAFTVALDAQPASPVMLTVVSADEGEATVDVTSLTFDSGNWNVPQTVTVTGVDDDLLDGDRTTDVTVAVDPDSSDDGFDDIADGIVTVTTVDDDAAAFLIAESDATTSVTEAGGTDDFTVALGAEPVDDVILTVMSGDTGEVTALPATLTFTASDWNVPQPVTVTGVDDQLDDGDVVSDVIIAVDDASSDDGFDGLADSVQVTTVDDDAAGITVVESDDGTLVTEEGGTDSVSVSLAARPLTDVVLTVSASDATEASVDPPTLTFTTTNWDDAQTVTVTGVNDAVVDGFQTSLVILAVDEGASDASYAGLADETVSVTTTDDDVPAGILVQTGGTITLSEAGGADQFTVEIVAAPFEDVTIVVESGDATEVGVDPTTLLFTPDDWEGPRVVQVTGIDDALIDGNQVTDLTIGVAPGSDASYLLVPDTMIQVTTTDDDGAGVTLADTLNRTVTEAGSTTQFTAVLRSQPASNVVLNVTASDPTEVLVDSTTVTFTPSDWNTPRAVLLRGVDDELADGNVASFVTVSVDAGSDPDYVGLADQGVGVTTTDDDDVGLAIQDFGGVSVSETGTTDDFEVALSSQPDDSVVVTITSLDLGEATAAPATLVFRPADWDAAQTVTVTGVDDAIQDDDQTTPVVVSVDASVSDPGFGAVPDDTVQVVTTDDDDVGFTITESSSTIVSEDGTSDDFSVVLDAQPQPSTEVVLLVSSADEGEVTVDPAVLTFTFDDWDQPQSVAVTGVDDLLLDGAVLTAVTVEVDDLTSDPNFALVPDAVVNVTTEDDDLAGFTLGSTVGKSVAESGTTDAFTVVLDARPVAPVVFTVSSGDASEGVVAPTTVGFQPGAWNVAQTVVITGVDDAEIDGPVGYQVTVAVDAGGSDPAFAAVPSQSVAATTTDDDLAGFSVAEFGGVRVNEGGSTDDFDVVLQAQPASNVIVTVANPDPSEVSAAPTTLTFTPADWNDPQTVTVTGVDDALDDGDQVTTLVMSVQAGSDPLFTGLPDIPVDVTTTDDDGIGFSITEIGSTIVYEDGRSDDFTVVLDAEPQAGTQVVLLISSADEGEATIDPASLTFTPADWDDPQIVTVTGVDDTTADGDQVTVVSIAVGPATTDPEYAGLPDGTVNVTTVDDDLPGFVLSQTTGKSVSETGTTDQFTARLSIEPGGPVVLTVTGDDPGEGSVAPVTLSFGPGDWNTPQPVTITGVDDDLLDGPQNWTATVAVDAGASDAAFAGVADQTVDVTTTDDDASGIVVDDLDGVTVSEAGLADAFDVVLTAEPASNVVLDVASSDPGEAVAGPTTLTFTPSDWSEPRTVTVTGVDDAFADGAQVVDITVTVDGGLSDPAFASVPPITVSATNLDDDGAGISYGDATGKSVSETGTTDAFTVVLDAEPAPGAQVVLDVVSNDPGEVVVGPSQLVFTPADWNLPRTVILTGVDDAIVDGPQLSTISIVVDDIVSDPGYALVPNGSIPVTTTDDDASGFALTNTAGKTVDESGTSDEFTVVLGAQPPSAVVLSVSSSDAGEATVTPVTLTFTPGAWDVPRTVMIVGADDDLIDGPQTSTIEVAVVPGSSDPSFSSVPPQSFGVTTTDDDGAGFLIADFGGVTVNESGSTDDFAVELTAQPAADVVITVTSLDEAEVVVDPVTLTFTPADWETPQVVTATGVDDAFDDDDQVTGVVVAVDAGASDAAFGSVAPDTVNVTTRDDDGVGFSITEVGSTIVTEAGGTDEFAVALDVIPASDVVLVVASADLGEVTVAPATLTFTPTNWDTPQVVIATGVEDTETDGDVMTEITVSVDVDNSDPAFAIVPAGTVVATTLDNDGTLVGRVFDDLDGNGLQNGPEPGLAGVDVMVTASSGPPRSATTDASGDWIVTGLPAGAATVDVVEATLPAGATQTAGTDPSGAVVVAGTDTDTGSDGYQFRGSLSGHVFDDTDGDGTQDAGEADRAGVELTVTDSQGGSRVVTTDGAGDWTATDVPVGGASVLVNEASLPLGAARTAGDDPTLVTVLAGQNVAGGVDGYQIQGALSGVVYHDENGNGTQDGGEPGLGGVQLTVTDAVGSVTSATTDVGGTWTADSLAVGSASADVLDGTLPPGSVLTGGVDPTSGTVSAGATSAATPVGYQIRGGLTGRVFGDADGNGVQNGGESGLGGVGVVVTDSQGNVSSVTTDGAGDWNANGLAVGSASVDVTDADLPVGSALTGGADPETVTVVGGLTTGAGTDGYQPQGSLGGTIFEDLDGNGIQDGGDAGLPDVVVDVTDSSGSVRSGTTAADGTWTVDSLAIGSATVTIDETTLPPEVVQTTGTDPNGATVTAGATGAGGTDGFQPLGSLSGHLFVDLDADGVQDAGEPDLTGVSVDVLDSGGSTRSGATDANGDWTVDSLATGDAQVDIDDTTLPAGAVQTAGSDPELVAVVRNLTTDAGTDGYLVTGSLSGQVFTDLDGNGIRDGADSGIAGVTVDVTGALSTTASTVTGALGTWTVGGLAPGPANVDIDDGTLPAGSVATGGADPETVAVTAGVTAPGGDDGYQPQGSLSGRVFEDTNGNGADDGEPGLPGVSVDVTDVLGTTVTVVADANGLWTASGLPAGAASVDVDEATLPVGVVQTAGSDPNPSVVVVAGSDTDAGFDGYFPGPQ